MGGHFCAFSFVDRIIDLDPGVRAHARYTIPKTLLAFPISLVAESIGQVAAWVAMAATGFRAPPGAGLGGHVDILGVAQPGHTLDVAVDLDSLERDAIAYRGRAHADGVAVLELHECVGPMLPADQFDDPVALRERFDVLRGSGAAPGGFPGVDPLPLQVFEGRGPQRRATLSIPASASFFADHFPRRPVLPGTLLLDAMFRLACLVAHDVAPPGEARVWSPRAALGVKIRAFTPPGVTLAIEATLREADPQRLRFRLGAVVDDKSVASARVELLAGDEG